MSHSHLCNLAKSSDSMTTSMDPTLKKHPKASPFSTTTNTASTTKPHPTPPDPTNISPSTVQNISNHFSRLYSNHKALASLKHSSDKHPHPHPHPHPCLDTHLQGKATSLSTISDGPTSSLNKPTRKYRKVVRDLKTAAKVKEKETKSTKKSHEDHIDTKRAIVSYKTEEIKKPSKAEMEQMESLLEGHDIKKPIVVVSANQEIEVLKGFKEGYEMKRASVSVAGMGDRGRRRSFCCSQTELANFLSCNGVKVVSVDMPPFMQMHAVDCARKTCDSLEKFTAKTLASTLKKEFDGVYGPAWHCIVGKSFGSFVTYSVGGFLYFSMDHKLYILLFKTTVQKAE